MHEKSDIWTQPNRQESFYFTDVHQYAQNNTETATRKDVQPASKVNSTNEDHSKIRKPTVTITKTNSTVLKEKEAFSGKLKEKSKKNSRNLKHGSSK
jgi:hypothetical protein